MLASITIDYSTTLERALQLTLVWPIDSYLLHSQTIVFPMAMALFPNPASVADMIGVRTLEQKLGLVSVQPR